MLKIKNKKSQMKMQRMAVMLVAVTIFLVIAGIFGFALKYSSIQKGATLLQKENAKALASRLANSPEFSCGEGYGGDRINCVDSDKIMALSQNSEKYENFWGVENIEIIKIPLENIGAVCNLNNYPLCDKIKIFNKETRGISSSTFVSLCRKESFNGDSYDYCDIAKIMVSYRTG